MKFSPSVCVTLVASLTGEMSAQSFIYRAHGTADGDKFCCYPWLECHDIKPAMHCLLRFASTMINHLTTISYLIVGGGVTLLYKAWKAPKNVIFVRLWKHYELGQKWHSNVAPMSPRLHWLLLKCQEDFCSHDTNCKYHYVLWKSCF